MGDTQADRRPAGELEASVLAALWTADTPLTPLEVQVALGGGLARTTVTTILTRMQAKGMVTRARAGRGYLYAPAQDAPGLIARRMHAELDKDEDRRTVLARFVSELSTEDERVLRALLDAADEVGEADEPMDTDETEGAGEAASGVGEAASGAGQAVVVIRADDGVGGGDGVS